ncbi:MAG: hypothetical protein ACXADL_13795 [Candidatus Thorarchaeota archaeon]|jgi:hypothetical protein
MPYSRYSRREIFLNNDRNYKNVFFKNRDMEQVFQYDSPQIAFPNPSEIRNLTSLLMVWGATDKLYNVSAKYYGSPEYWWVIAWYNQKASEAEFKVGDEYYVPLPLDEVLEYVG